MPSMRSFRFARGRGRETRAERWWRVRETRTERRFRRLMIETLEGRQLLTGTSGWFSAPAPDWFGAVDGPTLLGDERAEGQSLSRFIVRLDADFSAAIGSARHSWQVFYPSTVLAEGVTPPWARFRAIAGLGLPGQILIESRAPQEQAAADLAGLAHIDSFEPERKIGGAAVPNDPQFGGQIGLHNTGQTPPGGTDDADIDAPEAWELQTGSRDVVVAVVDSGIDYTHPDLAANIWTNPGEAGALANNGIDDDLNGFKDDVHGYDFVNNDGDPLDDNGHGTHVAGTIGAVGNNGVGVTGVAWQASLMALKFLDGNLRGTTSDAIEAFNYMTMMKNRTVNPVNIAVSNNSWGFSGGIDVGLRQAIQAAGSAGILTVAAAGNGNALGVGINNDESPFYPASFADNTIISVAASDKNDGLVPLSNFGRTSVDIAAPGAGIVSTLPGSSYGSKTGTSMATAHVSGVAALVFAEHPDATPQEVRDAILKGNDPITPLGPRLLSGGRVNAHGALTAETFAPKAELLSAPDITPQTADTSKVTITVRYRDDELLDAGSFSPTNILVKRVGFSSDVGQVYFESSSRITSPVGGGDAYDVVYQVFPAQGFTATEAGEYTISVQANQVVDNDGLAAAAQVLGKFKVTLSDPLHVFIVNTIDDTVDANPGDGLARDAQGRTSLRAAVIEANHRLQPVTIILPDGTYRLRIAESSTTGDLEGRIGDLDILSNIEIRGTGINTTIIDAQQKSRAFELIPVSRFPAGMDQSPGSLTLKSLAIKNGQADSGGAVLVGGDLDAGSTLVIKHCLLTGNISQYRGGAIASVEGSNTVTIEATTIDKNSTVAEFGHDYGGGGIFNRGNLTVSASTVSNNIAMGGLLESGGGGGVLHVGPGFLNLVNSTISSNTATQSVGGGLTLAGPSKVINSTITRNQAPRGLGGGLYGDSMAAAGSKIGYAVADESVRGTSVIGAPKASVNGVPGAGAIYTYLQNSQSIADFENFYQDILIENPEPAAGEYFGHSVAVDHGFIVVGAPGDDVGGADAGTAYVFDAATGNLLHTLRGPAAAAEDNFGFSVAISGDLIVVGAPFADVGAVNAGAAYLFSASTGTLIRTLNNPSPDEEDAFGYSLDVVENAPIGLPNNTVLVGAPCDTVSSVVCAGAAYRFQLLQAGSEPTPYFNPAPGPFDFFGYAVTLEELGSLVAIGVPNDDVGGVNAGSVHVYDMQSTSPLGVLRNPTPASDDFFGNAVAFQLGDIIVGAPGADDHDFDAGAAYSFDVANGSLQLGRFGASAGDQLGTSVSVHSVGAPFSDSNGVDSGEAFYRSSFFLPLFSARLSPVPLQLRHTIVSENSTNPSFLPATAPDVGGSIWDNGGNLFGQIFEPRNFSFRSLKGGTPNLGPLQDNGGPTLTHALPRNSLAVDNSTLAPVVLPGVPTTDQRGRARPFEGTEVINFADIGALERYPAIHGVKFLDRSGDGVRQASEPGISGQTIFVDRNENGRLDPNEPQTQTQADDPFTPGIDESGQYELQNLSYGPVLVSQVEEPGVVNQTPRAIARDASLTFRKLVDTSSIRPGSGDTFTGFRPPVLGDDRVVFAEVGSSGGLYASQTDGSLSKLLLPGEMVSAGVPLQAVVSYDFDGDMAVISAGNNSTSQIVIAQLDGKVVPVQGFAGAPSGKVSVGGGLVAFHTLSPERIYLSAVDPEQTSSATTFAAVVADGFTDYAPPDYFQDVIYTDIFDPRVDPVRKDVAYAARLDDIFGFALYLGRAGNGFGVEDLPFAGFSNGQTGEFSARSVRTLAAAADEIVFSVKEDTGKEGIHLLTRGYVVFPSTRIVDSTMPVPGGVGSFQGLEAANAAMSNRAVVFAARDEAGESGLYLSQDDDTLRKVISTTDTLDGKGISRLHLADGHTLDENKLAFSVEFDDGSQAIYVTEFESIVGVRSLVENPRVDVQIDFPATFTPAEIHGVAFVDLNRNGEKDDNEPTLTGRTVFLDRNDNGAADTDEPMTTTDASGSYSFVGLEPLQTYVVAVVPDQEEVQTAPLSNDGRYLVRPGPGQIVTSINFGLAVSTAGGAGQGSKLSGSLFISANGNGNLAAGASGLAELLQNLLVYFDQNGNGNPDPGEPATVPNGQGQYSFSGLENSNVQIRVARRPGMTQTSPLQSNSFSEKRADLPVKPESAAAGDFDHQPGEELAVTMSKEDAVWIVRPSSTGAITVVQKLKTHDYPGGVAVADLNNDGWADLIVSNAYGNDISIFVNQKNPAAPFLTATPLHYPTQNVARPAGVPQGIAIGDFNGDELNDIAVANSFSNDVAIFLNETAGQTVKFRLASRPTVGKRPLAVVAGQFAGDSNLDLAIANNGNGTTGSSSVTILEGTGSGTFTFFKTIKVADGPTAIAAGKLNGEFTDLVTANYAANRVTILRGQGGGQFDKEEISAGVGPSSVAIVDVDGDGDRDIAISNGSDAAAKNHLLVIRNQGGGIFKAAEPAGSAQFFPDAAFSVVVGDFDGVMGNDLALVNPILPTGAGSESGQLAVYFNQIASDGSLRVALETPREIAGLDFGLAFPWHNLIKALDVSGDGSIVAGDALDIINFLNSFGSQPVPPNLKTFGPFYDVTADGTAAANDALDVINYLNAFGADAEGETAATLLAAPVDRPSLTSDSRLNDLMALLAFDVASQPKRRNR